MSDKIKNLRGLLGTKPVKPEPKVSDGPCPACGRMVCGLSCPLDKAGYGR